MKNFLMISAMMLALSACMNMTPSEMTNCKSRPMNHHKMGGTMDHCMMKHDSKMMHKDMDKKHMKMMCKKMKRGMLKKDEMMGMSKDEMKAMCKKMKRDMMKK